jgi:hypothetical protein
VGDKSTGEASLARRTEEDDFDEFQGQTAFDLLSNTTTLHDYASTLPAHTYK